MRIVLKIAAWGLGILIGLPLVLILLVFVLLNTGFGRSQVEHLTSQLTGGQVAISGLSGRFPDALRLAHAELRDSQGAWLTLDGIALNWSPSRLLSREARVDLLLADRIVVARLPVAAPNTPPQPSSSTPFNLPVRVSVETLRVARAEIGAPVAGVAAVLALNGSAHLASLQDGDADVVIDRLDEPGSYAVHGRIDPARIAARLRLNEPAGGLIARIAKLPNIGTIAMQANVDGPRNAEATTLALTAGPLTANARGTLDLTGQAADLDVTANAPAMTPAPGVSWQTVALDAHVHGPFTKPDATGTLNLTGFQAAGVTFASLAAQLQGNQGAAGLKASITGLHIPGPKPDLLAADPVTLQADVRLDDPKRPVVFTLAHPLIQAHGTANTGGDITTHTDITLPDLTPLAAIGAVDLAGHAQLGIQAALAGSTTKVDVDGTIGVTGGMAPVPALVGDAAKIGVSVAMTGSDISVTRAQIDGKTINLAASGTDKAGVLDLAYQLGLTNLAVLAPTIDGAVTLQGTAKGPTDSLAVDVAAKGDVGAKGIPRGPVTLAVHATGLPGKPAGTVTARGTLEGAPLDVSLRADRADDGTMDATIDRADWRSLHAEGALTLPPGSTLPRGKVSLHMTQLADLRPFVGQPVNGAVTADIALDPTAITLALDATRAGIPGSEVARARLAARVTDPLAHPVVDATLDADGIAAGGIAGNAKLTVKGPEEALALRLNAALQGLAGADATIATAATLNVPGKAVQLASLSAVWKGQDLHLLAPARVNFGDGVSIDRLRLGLQQAVLEIAGRATPALNLTASLRGVTPDLAKPFAPDIDAAGQISADARLTGTPAAPQGTVKLQATGLRMRTGPARSLPAANLTATAQLAGQAANLDAHLVAGSTTLNVTGRAPLGQGALALRANGGVDLAMLDPILAAQGRRARGHIALDASIAGTTSAPLINGSVTLAGGEVQDFTQGVHLTDLAARIQATGQTIRIASFTGRAGAGTMSAAGSVGLQGAMPVDLTLTMRNARALASDMLTADLDADLTVKGDVSGALAAAGTIAIQRATINIPEHLPSSVAVLDVRVAGQKPPPPPAPGPAIRLNLTLTTPGQIFVRGRGLDAVLGGTLHVAGTSAAPALSGGFTMQHGTFSLAGTTLTFSRGKVSFAGSGATNKIDPSLDFEADVTNSTMTAMILVTGYASAPKITLASTPSAPQDEVLAQLLFGTGAKNLGPLQYAEIVSALAELTGTTSGGNPLDTVRKGLGLDRLNVSSGSGTTAGAGSNASATIEAGRYVANGVYVGAKQGTSGSQTQATVEIDIFKGLKAVTDVGTGAGGNSVGLTYQFDY